MVLLIPPLSAQQQSADTRESADGSAPEENRRIERLGEVSTERWEMNLALPGNGSEATEDGTALVLLDEAQRQQLQQLMSSLSTRPGDSGVLAQLDTLLTDVLKQANGLFDAGAVVEAGRLLALIQSINPGLDGLDLANHRLQTFNETIGLLKAGDEALESQRVLEPENDSALYYFKLALSKDPQSQSARQGLARVQAALLERALESARELDFEMAESWLSEASAAHANQQPVQAGRAELEKFKQDYADELEHKAHSAMNSGDFNLADFTIIDLIALGGHEDRVASLRARLEEARHYGGFEPGQTIKDELLKSGGEAPEIVIIAAGSFLMGSRERSDDDDDKDHEKPLHRVTIAKGFGLGAREVSVAEFRLFIVKSGYRTDAERAGSSRVYDEAAGRLSQREGINWQYDYRGKEADSEMPVLHVSVYDAEAYIDWLSAETGKSYRLPSEAEYEYVARAGGKSTYWWGEGAPDEPVENLTGELDKSPRNRQWSTFFKKYGDGHWGPGPTGSIGSGKLVHPMGVFDIAGNVSEWTQDCWHENYIKAPVDGSAWVNPGCDRRVARGGYWASAPEQSRAAFRISARAGSYGPVIGFRIARDL